MVLESHLTVSGIVSERMTYLSQIVNDFNRLRMQRLSSDVKTAEVKEHVYLVI